MYNINGLLLKGDTEEEQLEYLKILVNLIDNANETSKKIVKNIKEHEKYATKEYH
jgi:hypothetical protein